MDRRQQPNPFKGLSIDRKLKNIPDFNKQNPRPFRDTDGGEAGVQGWTFIDFLSRFEKEQKEKWWKFDTLKRVIGFESEGRKLFLRLAEIVISFHEGKTFSGNLVRRIRILPDLNVTHESSPQQDEQAFQNGGQRSDIDHFRWMVAAVVRTAFPDTYDTILSPHFLLFFSEIFTVEEGLEYYFVSQLYHPIFFNSSDRCNLIHTVRDLYNLNPYMFKKHFELQSYGYYSWWGRIFWKKMKYEGAFLSVLKYNGNFDSLYNKSNASALPLYIRNVHEHHGRGWHEDVDLEIDILFPGVCAAIIDSAIRNLHSYRSLFRSTTLSYLQRTSPYGWCFPDYRFRN